MGAHVKGKNKSGSAAARSNQPKRKSKRFDRSSQHVKKGLDTGGRRRRASFAAARGVCPPDPRPRARPRPLASRPASVRSMTRRGSWGT